MRRFLALASPATAGVAIAGRGGAHKAVDKDAQVARCVRTILIQEQLKARNADCGPQSVRIVRHLVNADSRLDVICTHPDGNSYVCRASRGSSPLGDGGRALPWRRNRPVLSARTSASSLDQRRAGGRDRCLASGSVHATVMAECLRMALSMVSVVPKRSGIDS